MPEINIICIRQNKKLKNPTADLEIFRCNKKQKDMKGYQDNFYCMGALYGNWYQILSKKNFDADDFVCGAYDVMDGEICDKPADYYRTRLMDKSDIAFYRENPGYLLQSAVIAQEMKPSFLQILKASLQASKIGMTAFLIRECIDPPENIFGCVDFDEFVRRLNSLEIYYNAVYIIKDDRCFSNCGTGKNGK